MGLADPETRSVMPRETWWRERVGDVGVALADIGSCSTAALVKVFVVEICAGIN